MVQGSKLQKLAKIPSVSKTQKSAARSLALSVAFLIAFVSSPSSPFGPDTACADPMTDSFASGGTKPARRPVKPASKGGGGASRSGPRKPAAPAAPAPKRKPSGRSKVRNEDEPPAADTAPAAEEETPRREVPVDSPRARRAAEPDESRSSSDDGDRSSSDEGSEADDEERSRPKPRVKARPVPARRPVATKARKKRDSDEENESETEGADNDEDENEDNGPSAESLPSIAPRAFSLGLGLGLMGRSFDFAAPAQLQRERSFGRFGYKIDVETFPLMLISKDWWQHIGLGFSYAAEPIGQASVKNPTNGTSVDTPVDQSRWSVDLRAALPLGSRIVFTPRLGIESSSFTLSTKMPVMPSACTSTTTVACLPDTSTKMLAAGAILRAGVTPDLGFWLEAAYLVSLHVDNKPVNQIGYEIGTSATGLDLEVGGSLRFSDWLAVRAYVPITRIGYAFHPSTTTPAAVNYRSATELVWGFGAGLAVFNKIT
jgi:hypothetical protein